MTAAERSQDALQEPQAWAGRWVLAAGTAVLLLCVWEVSGRLELYNSKLLPPPTHVAAAFVDMLRSGEWLADLSASVGRYAAGLCFGAVLGVGVGIATGRVTWIDGALSPLFHFLRNTPSIALVPLSVVLLGISETGKVCVIAWGVFFPSWIGAHAGMRGLSQAYEWAGRSLGLRGANLFWKVVLPQALPQIVAGVRIAVSTGFFALAAAELAGAYSGVGFRIFASEQMFRTDKMMVAIVTIGCLGWLADRFFCWFVQTSCPWLKKGLGER